MKKSRLSYDEWDKVILNKTIKGETVEDRFFKGYIEKIEYRTYRQESRVICSFFSEKIGNITYNVSVHFNEQSKQNVQDKLKRVIIHKIDNG